MKLIDSLFERFGMNAYALGRFDEAEKWFRRLERKEPDSIRVLRNLGVILLANGNVPEAERYLRREIALYGETLQRKRTLADLRYIAGARADARAAYASALADPDALAMPERERRFIQERLSICADAGRFEASRESAAFFAEGESARVKGDADAALRLFLEAADRDPTNWPACNNAGVILLERADGAVKALELFSRAASFVSVPMIEQNLKLAKERTGP